MTRNQILLIQFTAIVLTSGCKNENGRIADLATAAAERQAQQSTEIAKAHSQLTQGARELVESAGRSQESLITIQHDLETQQAEVGRQRDQLEKERRIIAAERRTDPVIANAILQFGILIVCVLPLIICWYVLQSPAANGVDQLVSEILIEDLTAEQPRLLPGPSTTAAEPAGHLPLSN